MFYVLYLYLNAFRRFRFGYAAAQAWILFIVIFILTILFSTNVYGDLKKCIVDGFFEEAPQTLSCDFSGTRG